MEELDFYDGAYSGQEIDEAIGLVRARTNEVAYSNAGLLTSTGAYRAIANQIIIVTISAVTGTGGIVTETSIFNPGSGAFFAHITSDHRVIWCELSNPSALVGDLEVTTANNQITISGAINGTTDITLILGAVGGTVS